MTLQELFTDIATFRKYTTNLKSNVSFEELAANAKLAFKQISLIIPQAVLESIQEQEDLVEDLRMSVANCILFRQSPFDAVASRKDGTDIYKYELESMQRSYRENYYDSMDSLLQKLDDSAIEAWKTTEYALLLQELPIKNTSEMNSLYPIDNSHLFFFRTIPFQQEVADSLANLITQALDSAILTRRLKRVIAKKTVALSMRQFDLLELPATIRNLFMDSKVSRNSKQEQEHMLLLSHDLDNAAAEEITALENLLKSDTETDITTQTSFNEPNDKIFFMP